MAQALLVASQQKTGGTLMYIAIKNGNTEVASLIRRAAYGERLPMPVRFAATQ